MVMPRSSPAFSAPACATDQKVPPSPCVYTQILMSLFAGAADSVSVEAVSVDAVSPESLAPAAQPARVRATTPVRTANFLISKFGPLILELLDLGRAHSQRNAPYKDYRLCMHKKITNPRCCYRNATLHFPDDWTSDSSKTPENRGKMNKVVPLPKVSFCHQAKVTTLG